VASTARSRKKVNKNLNKSNNSNDSMSDEYNNSESIERQNNRMLMQVLLNNLYKSEIPQAKKLTRQNKPSNDPRD